MCDGRGKGHAEGDARKVSRTFEKVGNAFTPVAAYRIGEVRPETNADSGQRLTSAVNPGRGYHPIVSRRRSGSSKGT